MMADPAFPRGTISSYLEEEYRSIQKSEQLFRQLSLRRIKDELRLAKRTEEEVEEVAECILEGEEVLPLASDDGEIDNDHLKKANDVGQTFISVIHRRFLNLVFPNTNKKYRLGVAQDHEAWSCIFKSFIESHAGFKENEEQNKSDVHTIFTMDELEEALKTFIETDAQSCYEATILFGGHGNKNGMVLYDEVDSLPIDKVTDLVRSLINDSDILAKHRLPLKLRLLYTQCYGHETHSGGGGDTFDNKLEVTTLATEYCPEPIMIIKRDKDKSGNTIRVTSGRILNLNKIAAAQPIAPFKFLLRGPSDPEHGESTPMEVDTVQTVDMDTNN